MYLNTNYGRSMGDCDLVPATHSPLRMYSVAPVFFSSMYAPQTCSYLSPELTVFVLFLHDSRITNVLVTVPQDSRIISWTPEHDNPKKTPSWTSSSEVSSCRATLIKNMSVNGPIKTKHKFSLYAHSPT